jgi:hypothetical protein
MMIITLTVTFIILVQTTHSFLLLEKKRIPISNFHIDDCLQQSRRSVHLFANHDTKEQLNLSRRTFAFKLSTCVGLSTSLVIVPTTAVTAASKLPDEESSKQKILSGYRRLNYLLDNWETETTICGRSDNPYVTSKGCERTPLKVMDYLGYRNIDDPLFRADKTMKKLEPLIPNDRFGDYLDAIEKWSEAAEEGNGMAYISSWGEANPGGGKDRVELFIERARKNVIDSRDSLGTVIDILELK